MNIKASIKKNLSYIHIKNIRKHKVYIHILPVVKEKLDRF